MGEALDCLWLRDLDYIYSHYRSLGDGVKYLTGFSASGKCMSVLPGVASKITTTPSSFGISFQNLNENAVV